VYCSVENLGFPFKAADLWSVGLPNLRGSLAQSHKPNCLQRRFSTEHECTVCRKRFDDLTGTIFAGHHQPLRVWMLCLYFMGLNLSNEQIAHELDLNSDDAQNMTTQLREGIVERKPKVTLSGEVECDEVYVVAGHKGKPEEVKKKGGPGAAVG